MTEFGDLRLAWLETFVETADARKRTAAASAVGTTQSNVTKHLDKLWGWYGYPLVVPGSSPLRMTAEGERFLKVARRVVRQLKNARPARSEAPPEQGPPVSGSDVRLG